MDLRTWSLGQGKPMTQWVSRRICWAQHRAGLTAKIYLSKGKRYEGQCGGSQTQASKSPVFTAVQDGSNSSSKELWWHLTALSAKETWGPRFCSGVGHVDTNPSAYCAPNSRVSDRKQVFNIFVQPGQNEPLWSLREWGTVYQSSSRLQPMASLTNRSLQGHGVRSALGALLCTLPLDCLPVCLLSNPRKPPMHTSQDSFVDISLLVLHTVTLRKWL
jgi:hypothetical protein